jgi:hypothetical protein
LIFKVPFVVVAVAEVVAVSEVKIVHKGTLNLLIVAAAASCLELAFHPFDRDYLFDSSYLSFP